MSKVTVKPSVSPWELARITVEPVGRGVSLTVISQGDEQTLTPAEARTIGTALLDAADEAGR